MKWCLKASRKKKTTKRPNTPRSSGCCCQKMFIFIASPVCCPSLPWHCFFLLFFLHSISPKSILPSSFPATVSNKWWRSKSEDTCLCAPLFRFLSAFTQFTVIFARPSHPALSERSVTSSCKGREWFQTHKKKKKQDRSPLGNVKLVPQF